MLAFVLFGKKRCTKATNNPGRSIQDSKTSMVWPEDSQDGLCNKGWFPRSFPTLETRRPQVVHPALFTTCPLCQSTVHEIKQSMVLEQGWGFKGWLRAGQNVPSTLSPFALSSSEKALLQATWAMFCQGHNPKCQESLKFGRKFPTVI